jgi:hypothetical protein
MRLFGVYLMERNLREAVESFRAAYQRFKGDRAMEENSERQLAALSKGLAAYEQFTRSCARDFWDLGAVGIVGAENFSEATRGTQESRNWCERLPQEIRACRVMVNPALWSMVFSQAVKNAEDAAGTCYGLDGFEEKMSLIGRAEGGWLHLELGNRVEVDRMKKALLPLESGFLSWGMDEVDHTRKQRLFMSGVTSRPPEEIDDSHGGIGLALAYAFMRKMNGKIYAEYDPVRNWFTMHLLLPLAEPV